MSSDFRVIIVGGSIAGLTLNHCLNIAGIDNIVLEKHAEIASQELIKPLTSAHIAYPDGFTFRSDYPVTVNERFCRPMAFLTRQELIQVLPDFFEDTSHIHVNQRVAEVQHGEDRVRMVTEDGISYEGDMVVGADEIHSKVRSEMWSFSSSPDLAGIALREHRGIMLIIYLKYNVAPRVYWFVVEKLDRKYTYPHLPCFIQQDAINGCERLGGVWLRNTVHFPDVWAHRETFTMTALEECVLRLWHSGRIVCIGDSIHKMTPNLGQGANLASEDAAELANFLYAMLTGRNTGKPSGPVINDLLQTFEYKQVKRATHIIKMSALMSRLHAQQGLFYTLISVVIDGAAVLNYLPVPSREAMG
ncbi:hypothetical protein BJX63DRAFT_421036 [Aspergillus granulosus]|uniref:FAD-binding domain-containing protein n=1 Tax=Aspergillus granulosus TaxID=176169 RepID=A0ABR4HEC3_9EURO